MKIKGSFDYGENYSLRFVNGAFGGLTSNNKEIVVNFYFENLPLPKEYELNIDDNGNVSESIIKPDIIDVNRKVESGIIMDLDTAKLIHGWLGNTIQDLEKSIGEE